MGTLTKTGNSSQGGTFWWFGWKSSFPIKFCSSLSLSHESDGSHRPHPGFARNGQNLGWATTEPSFLMEERRTEAHQIQSEAVLHLVHDSFLAKMAQKLEIARSCSLNYSTEPNCKWRTLDLLADLPRNSAWVSPGQNVQQGPQIRQKLAAIQEKFFSIKKTRTLAYPAKQDFACHLLP